MMDDFRPTPKRQADFDVRSKPMRSLRLQGVEAPLTASATTEGSASFDEPAFEPGSGLVNHSHKLKGPRLTKKQLIIIAAVAGVVIALGGAFAFTKLHSKKPAPVKAQVPAVAAPAPKSSTEASRLTGMQVQPELNTRPVTGVMIENSPDARPQSGLKDAGVVFEAVAEGGITRFLALFQESQPGYIGPVRSVRPYYVDWVTSFDAGIAHAGGSGEGLNDIKVLGAKDLDMLTNSSYAQRVKNRYAPHNLYTSMAQLDALSKSKGFTTSTFKSFTRKAEAPSATPNARSIDFAMSSFLYNPHYDYDQATNTYKRSEGGKPHIDEKSGAQLAPKTVVALVIPRSQNGIYSVYKTIGDGKMYVFQDGVVTQGTWHKSDRKAQYVFTDTTGKPLALNAGQTWFTAVADTGAVQYK